MYSTCLNIHNVTVRKLLSDMTIVFFFEVLKLNNRELDIKIYTPPPQNGYFPHIKHTFWVHFFYAPKTYVFINSYSFFS